MPIDNFNYIYEHTSKNSKLRLLFLHLSCVWMASDCFERHPEYSSKEMLLEVAALVANPGNANDQLRKAINASDWSRYKVPEA
jgi:hypothetical protein